MPEPIGVNAAMWDNMSDWKSILTRNAVISVETCSVSGPWRDVPAQWGVPGSPVPDRRRKEDQPLQTPAMATVRYKDFTRTTWRWIIARSYVTCHTRRLRSPLRCSCNRSGRPPEHRTSEQVLGTCRNGHALECPRATCHIVKAPTSPLFLLPWFQPLKVQLDLGVQSVNISEIVMSPLEVRRRLNAR